MRPDFQVSRYPHYLLSLLAPSQALVSRSLSHCTQSTTVGAEGSGATRSPRPSSGTGSSSTRSVTPLRPGGGGGPRASFRRGGAAKAPRLERLQTLHEGTCMNSKGSGPQPAGYHSLCSGWARPVGTPSPQPPSQFLFVSVSLCSVAPVQLSSKQWQPRPLGHQSRGSTFSDFRATAPLNFRSLQESKFRSHQLVPQGSKHPDTQ